MPLTWVVIVLAATAASCGPDVDSNAEISSGTPSYEQYVQAAQRAVQCMNDRGASASFIETDRRRININISATSATQEIDQIFDRCTEAELNAVESAFLASISPSREESLASLRDCLVINDLVEESATDEEIDRVIAAFPSGDARQEAASNCTLDAFQPKP